MPSIIIRSGGQTGVDRAALDVAVGLKLAYCGWCPKGGRAEDSPLPPGVLTRYPRLTETPSAESSQRSAWNVRDSHATLILSPGPEIAKFNGAQFTRSCADLFFLKPCLVADVGNTAGPAAVRNWLTKLFLVHPALDSFVLNVAGPRESEAPGVYAASSWFLRELAMSATRE
jgi:hypothetical protein